MPRRDNSPPMPSIRAKVNREIFRGMIFAVGGTSIALARAGVPRSAIWSYGKAATRTLCAMLGVSVTVRGGDLLADGGPYLFTPNHQSHFDIAALLGYLPGNNRFASKKELFEQPVLGDVMRVLGMLPVDRDDPMRSIEVLNWAVGKGDSLIIFPEGTRSPGPGMLPFKKGAFVAAIQMQRPVVPVAIKGTREVMPRGGYLSIEPGLVEIVVKPPIPTVGLGYEDRDRLRDAVREILEDEVARPIGADA